MSKDTQGIDKARETVEKIKGQIAIEKVQVQGLEVSKETADFYKANATVGFGNMARDSFPTLKVTESNSKGELANGDRPTIGYFYYTESKEEFKTLEVSIMTVSRGFYVKAMKAGEDPKFQQIISGMILDGMKPFIMYVGGRRLSPLWDLGKELSPYTKHKDSPVPMMAFKIKISTVNYKHEFGDSHYINFEVLKDEGKPRLITDVGALEVIRNGIETVEQAVESIIDATEVNRDTGEAKRVDLYATAEEALLGDEENNL